MINQDCELDAFKRDIDLRQFAMSLGYQIDRHESWRGSAVLRCAADKIVVKRNGNGHYVFFSLRDDDDNGTVIDFVQRRQHLSLGAVRQVLRPWIGRSANAPQFPQLQPASPDRMRIEREYRRMAEAQRYPYLERDRCVPAAVLSSPRFAGCMRIDARGNTVFPHFDAAGLCGKKGLWFSHSRPDDWRLVLTESAIDALSYATLFPDCADRTRYASLGGRPSSRQMGLVQAAVIKLADGAEVVAAFDADEAGRWLVAVTGDVVGNVRGQTERNDLGFRVHLPTTEGKDWNHDLQNRRTGSNSACQTGGR